MEAATWPEYQRWNDALAEHVLSPSNADSPVYLDVNAPSFLTAAAALGIQPEDAVEKLIEAVKPTLGLAGADASSTLAWHNQSYVEWRRKLHHVGSSREKRASTWDDPPPILALLYVLVIAASRMGADDTQAAHAYYPRLAQTLNLKQTEAIRLKRRFPITEAFWRGLNEFLERNEGRLGLPTAYSLGHRFVGIPQSQALIRAGDRAKLPSFFAEFGLTPGSELIPSDLERFLKEWIETNPSPVSSNLQRLFRRSSARERVAGVVAVELAHWDGTLPDTALRATRHKSSLLITALMRRTFTGRSIEFSLAAKLHQSSAASSLRVTSAEGQPRIAVIPAAGGYLVPMPGTRLDPVSLVGSMLELEETAGDQRTSRRPRRVVPFRKDELLGSYMETDRLQLAEDSLVLVRDDDPLIRQVLDVLTVNGRIGDLYGHAEEPGRKALAGMPVGWVLVEGVQLFAPPEGVERIELQVLVPATTARLTLAGGLKLPGRIRKWSRMEPPEIWASVAEAESLRLELYELGEERTLLESWTTTGPVMIKPLKGLDLEDGDYEAELYVNQEGSPISASSVRLRSADTPDAVVWETCTRLNYELDSPLGAISARAASDTSQLLVDGLYALGTRTQAPVPCEPPRAIGWRDSKDQSGPTTPLVVLGQADPNSCLATGAHFLLVDSTPTGNTYLSRCRDCGVAKAFPVRPRRKRHKTGAPAQQAVSLDLRDIQRDASLSWDSCLDALIHVGGGGIGSLERVALQAEGSSLFVDEFTRTLELLGHIDVRRDANMQPTEWEANPAYLAETTGGRFVLGGVWSQGRRQSLFEVAQSAGWDLRQATGTTGLSVWHLHGATANALQEMITAVGLDAYVVPDAIHRMLDVLPTLGEVEAALPAIPIPDYQKASLFDVSLAAWRHTPGVGQPGAYRLEQAFRRASVWISPENALVREAQVAGVQLVKHLAARRSNHPLIAYHQSTEHLVVPMGADLPGLYGRVVALCSGEPPKVSPPTRSIAYAHVPKDVATRITSLLLA